LKKKKVKRIFAAVLAFIMAFGIIIPTGFKEEASAATEIAITDIPWDEVEKVLPDYKIREKWLDKQRILL